MKARGCLSTLLLAALATATLTAAPAAWAPAAAARLESRAQHQLAERMALEVAGCGGYYSLLATASLARSDAAGLEMALRQQARAAALGERYDPQDGHDRRLAAREFLFRAIGGELGRMRELEATFPGHCGRLLDQPAIVLEELAQGLGLGVPAPGAAAEGRQAATQP